MILLSDIFFILIIHFFADFVFQTDKQARGKSKNMRDLLVHTTSYSSMWICFYPLWDNISKLLLFILITFITHTVIDYITSRVNSKLWAQGRVHDFFVSVGFDQLLHFIQLFTTFYLLNKL